MTFLELVDLHPYVKVCDIIQLFLLGYDDKVYLNLREEAHNDYILKSERIISDEWQFYYECEVQAIDTEPLDCADLSGLTLVIRRDRS